MSTTRTASSLARVTPSVEVLIIGGGVIGSAIAYHVARQGRSVLVVEREHVASEPTASWASAGGIRPQGIHPAEALLARAALTRWPLLSEELDADLHYRKDGHLLLAESEDEAHSLHLFVQQQNALGDVEVSFMDRQAALEMVPGLGEHITAASFSAASGHADPVRTTRAFAVAAQRYGVHYWTETECLALLRNDNRVVGALTTRGRVWAQQTVLAAGAWSHELSSSIGLQLPLKVRVLQTVRSSPTTPGLLGPVLSTVKGTLSLKQQPDGAFLLGGGWLGDLTPDGRSYILRPESQQGNWDLASQVFPLVGTLHCAGARGGLHIQTIDDLPLIGPAPGFSGLTLALGSWYGFTLAPAIGASIANQLVGLATPELKHLSPDRMAHVTPAEVTAFLNEATKANILE